MSQNKEYSIEMIESFLINKATKKQIYKYYKDENLYLALHNPYDENELLLVIIGFNWIKERKIKEWLVNYLMLPPLFKMNSYAIKKFETEFSLCYLKSTTKMKIIDLTLERNNIFDDLFLQKKSTEFWTNLYKESVFREFDSNTRNLSDILTEYKKELCINLFKLNESKKICVVSPFTYGKSALINSLLGSNILVEDILVKTAKVTKINFNTNSWLMKESESLILENYVNRHNFKTRLSYLSTINEQHCHSIHMTINSNLIRNFTIIDTPGLFGKYGQHDEITENILHDMDHIIYLLSPTQLGFEPYTKKIVEWQQKYKKRCVFVMNKIDLVKNDADRKNLIQEFYEKLGKQVENDGIFCVSAYRALKSRLYKNKEIDLMALRKDLVISVRKQDEIVSGRNFNEECVGLLEKQSGILELESYLESLYKGGDE